MYDQCRSQKMIESSRVAGLGARSLFLFCFPFCSSFPMSASIPRDVVRGFTLCASTHFFFFALLTCLPFLSLSLTLMRVNFAVVGVCIRPLCLYPFFIFALLTCLSFLSLFMALLRPNLQWWGVEKLNLCQNSYFHFSFF